MGSAAGTLAIGTRSGEAQKAWGKHSIHDRLRVVAKLRDRLASDASQLTPLFSSRLQRTAADSLTAEIIPLAEACRFLENEAESLLAPQVLNTRSRPAWLRRVTMTVLREPLGLVLVIGPANYPLFLPGVQSLQALVAGNAVLLKPGVGGSAVCQIFARWLEEAGLPPGVLTILDEDVEAAQEAIAAGVDKIVLTGSDQSGRAVGRQAANHGTPTAMELSGEDPFFVLPGANLERAAHALQFGQNLNGGFTCIAPRRLYVHEAVADRFEQLTNAWTSKRTTFKTAGEAERLANASRYALGATIFGKEREARELATLIDAGTVVINDMIVPTADPRLSFGGRKWSGFGKTRGAEGLLEMTTTKYVVTQRSKRLRHLEPSPPYAEQLFLHFLEAQHGIRWNTRLAGWRKLIKLLAAQRKKNDGSGRAASGIKENTNEQTQ